MKEIVYNKAREKNIRDTDLGRILRIIEAVIQEVRTVKIKERPSAITTLWEVKRRVKENKPK